MKKWITACVCLFLAAGLLAGCGAAPADQTDEKLKVVTTIFPAYDWARAVIGEEAEHVELTMLLDQGVDLHSYQPTVDDIVKVSSCDVFVYVGGASDDWTDDALSAAANKRMVTVNLLETLGEAVKEEEIMEGMEEEDDHDHEETEYDEHVWLSLKNAQVLCRALAETMAGADPDRAEAYRANAAAYCQKLAELDEAYAAAAESAGTKTVLFGDRFPFRYLTEDYGLTYYAAFAGCSAETEASFETIVFLAGKVDELGLHCILQTESANGSIAETIRQNTASADQEILTMDSLQSATMKDVEAGVTYLSVMEKNLRVLESALK
ncbi:MAG: zinc ABC transporter substrate-binding protein [Oscillospiraceae bacterium]|nr:zinc ABC transporter substrate-binding protein [Oscillospiraceae bacterium]